MIESMKLSIHLLIGLLLLLLSCSRQRPDNQGRESILECILNEYIAGLQGDSTMSIQIIQHRNWEKGASYISVFATPEEIELISDKGFKGMYKGFHVYLFPGQVDETRKVIRDTVFSEDIISNNLSWSELKTNLNDSRVKNEILWFSDYEFHCLYYSNLRCIRFFDYQEASTSKDRSTNQCSVCTDSSDSMEAQDSFGNK